MYSFGEVREVPHGAGETTIPGTCGSVWECVNNPRRLPSSCLEHAVGSGSRAPDRAGDPHSRQAPSDHPRTGHGHGFQSGSPKVVSLEIPKSFHSRFPGRLTRDSQIYVPFFRKKNPEKIVKINFSDSREQNKILKF